MSTFAHAIKPDRPRPKAPPWVGSHAHRRRPARLAEIGLPARENSRDEKTPVTGFFFLGEALPIAFRDHTEIAKAALRAGLVPFPSAGPGGIFNVHQSLS